MAQNTLARGGKWSGGARQDVFCSWCSVSSNLKVTKKCSTTDLRSPKQERDSKSAAGCDACQTSRTRGSPLPAWEPARRRAPWYSFLLCTGVHPTDHPRNSKGGLTSHLTALWVNPRVPLQAPSPDRYAGGQGNPAAQHCLVTVRPYPRSALE